MISCFKQHEPHEHRTIVFVNCIYCFIAIYVGCTSCNMHIEIISCTAFHSPIVLRESTEVAPFSVPLSLDEQNLR